MSVQSKATKTRSPNYPAISLEEAIQKLKVVYDQQQRYPATRETFAKLMGYSGLNGASATVVSALSKYGLFEGHGDQLRVSESGQDIVLHRKGDPEYTEAVQAAALMPAFFRELRDQYPTGLPSDHHLRASLIKRGFNSKAIDAAVRAYRDTMEFVDIETEGSVTESDGISRTEASMPVTQPIPTAYPGAQSSQGQATPSSFATTAPPVDGWDELVLWFRLSRESEARVAFKGHVTQEAIEKFIRLLRESVDTFPPSDESASHDTATGPERAA